PTDVFEVTTCTVTKHLWTPADFGIKRAALGSLSGGDAFRNKQILHEVLSGKPGPMRDIVAVNASAGLLVAGLAGDLISGVQLACHSIDSGAALAKLELLTKKFPVP
ncbi:MAG: anthranilate phosphoribosyltransferase, partial [Bryobacteraceae bacterium]